MRTFIMTDKYYGGTIILRRIRNYRWTKGKGLEYQLDYSSGIWVKSDYNLKEFLNGDCGHFQEVV